MIEITRTTEELVLDTILDRQDQDRRRSDQTGHKAAKAIEDLRRPTVYTGQTIYRAQVTTAVGPRSGSTVGTGVAILCILIGTTLYRRYPHVSVPVVNDAISATNIMVNTEIWIVMIDGKWSIIWQDCMDTSPSAFADQPH